MTPSDYHRVLVALTEAERHFEANSVDWSDGDRELYQALRLLRSEVLKRESGHPFPPSALTWTKGCLERAASAAGPKEAPQLVEKPVEAPRRIKVLVVDDEDGVRTVVRLLLGSAPDLDVFGTAANGREAIEMARRGSPDVILMDVNMPGMTGLEATRVILGERSETKVVLFTANRAASCLDLALQAGAVGVVFKPAGKEQLLRAVREAYAGGRRVGELAAKP